MSASLARVIRTGMVRTQFKPFIKPLIKPLIRSVPFGTTKPPTVISDDSPMHSMDIPKEYYTLYNIAMTGNINHPDQHKMTLDFLEIVRIENLSVISAFYETYIKNYEEYIRTHLMKSKEGMLYDVSWACYCTFIENYTERQLNYVFVQYIYGRCSDDSIGTRYGHLQYRAIKNRENIIRWFRLRLKKEIWASLVRSLSKSKSYTKLYELMKEEK